MAIVPGILCWLSFLGKEFYSGLGTVWTRAMLMKAGHLHWTYSFFSGVYDMYYLNNRMLYLRRHWLRPKEEILMSRVSGTLQSRGVERTQFTIRE
jgi:hypothetical protein